MKYFIIIAGVLVGLFIISQVWVYFTMQNIEYQDYETLEKEGAFEIRFYPEAYMASVTNEGKYDQLRNSQFRVLANYIFGGNESNQKISMTSPVVMEMGEDEMTMSFVMPAKWTIENLPKASEDQIDLKKTESTHVASIQFSGYASDQNIESNKAKLIEWLNNRNLKWKGNFSYLGYNPPWQTVNRRNEIIVALVDYQKP